MVDYINRKNIATAFTNNTPPDKKTSINVLSQQLKTANLTIKQKHQLAELIKFISIATRMEHVNNCHNSYVISVDKVRDKLREIGFIISDKKEDGIAAHLINLSIIRNSRQAGIKEFFLEHHTLPNSAKVFITEYLGISLSKMAFSERDVDVALRGYPNLEQKSLCGLLRFFNLRQDSLFHATKELLEDKKVDSTDLVSNRSMNKLSRLLNGQFPEGFKRNIPPMTKAEFSLASNVLADLNKNHYAPIIKSRNEITDKYKDELYKLYRPNEQKNTTSIVVNSQDIDNAFKSVGISQIKDYKDRISYILSSGSFLLSSTFCRVGYKVNSYNYVEFEMLHPLIAYIFNTYFTGDRIPMGGYDCKPALSMYFDIYLDNYINYKRNKKEIDLFCQNIYKIGNTLRIKDNGGDRNALC